MKGSLSARRADAAGSLELDREGAGPLGKL